MNDLQAVAIGGKLRFTFGWSGELPEGHSLTAIDYLLPAPLASFADVDDLPNKQGTIGIEGALHGATYLVRAVATLSNQEQIAKNLTVRGFNG